MKIISILVFINLSTVFAQFKSVSALPETFTNYDSANESVITPFSNLGNNILDSFTGNNILLQLSGIAATFALSSSNVDYHVSTYFENHTSYANIAVPAVILGSSLPLTAGAFLYIYGKIKSDDNMIGASYAVLQSGLITVSYITLLKAITARAHPNPNSPEDRKEISKTFHFGFLRGGVYRGWPSGHTGGAMATASALAGYYPDKTWLKILGYTWVAYTAASVSVYHKGTMHWFSDAVAACLMTYSFGIHTGQYFNNKINNTKEDKFKFLPVLQDGYTGVFLSYSF